jgi:putative membrane protein
MLAAFSGHMWGPGPWFLLFPFLWLVVIVALVRFFGRRHRWHTRSAEDVLAERYARGEISEEEYRERARVLGESK